MRKLRLAIPLSIVLFGLPFGCRPEPDPLVLQIPTSLHLQMMHHAVPLPDVNVFLKYNCDTFPGYEQQTAYYDTVLVSDANGDISVSPVPPGHHWVVALGASEHGIPLPVFGRMPIYIDLENRIKVDTMLYMYE